MKNLSHDMAELQKHTAASQELNKWVTSAQAFFLLSAAFECGIIDALRVPSTSAQIAAGTKIDAARIEDILLALEAHDIAMRQDGLYQLTPSLALLASPTAIQPLASMLRNASVKMRTLQAIASSKDIFTAQPPEDILAMAGGMGVSSLSPARTIMGLLLGQNFPELKELWEKGARHLEVGCGVGNNLLQVATTYPKVTAVGIEIDSLTATEAERRAGVLGVSDRVEVRTMDAGDLQDVAAFDTAQWSQFFFPEVSRPRVLAALLRAMKPGGYVQMPLLPAVPPDFAMRRRDMLRMTWHALRSEPFFALPFLKDYIGATAAYRRQEKRHATIQRLLYGLWGVHVRTAPELREEMERTGFHVVRAVSMPATQLSVSRGLMLTQKPMVHEVPQ